ncbi:MAG: Maf family protein [Lachnospiraceae bacterium]
MEIILASASPRRKELLEQIGIKFSVEISACEEIITKNNPEEIVEELSKLKATDIFLKNQNKLIIGADTIVFKDHNILGKPKDKEEARWMIQKLQGSVHQVYSGVTLIYKKNNEVIYRVFTEKTDVYVAKMEQKEIESYIETREPYDKAGAYGIQGIFAKFIEKIDGDYNNVVGLPIRKIYKELKDIKEVSLCMNMMK